MLVGRRARSLLKEAADVAFEFRDQSSLWTVQQAARKARNDAIAEHAGNLIAQLSAKK